MDLLAERALDAARHRLLDSGNPAFLAVSVPEDGRPQLSPLVVANLQSAAPGVRALTEALPGQPVLVVGCARQGRHLRFTVHTPESGDVVLDRLEVRERAIGEGLMV